MERDVNPQDDRSTPEWTFDLAKFGQALELAIREAGLTQVEVARRIAPGVKNKHKVLNRWVAGNGLAADQIAMIFGVMKENPTAMERILRFFGIGLPAETSYETRDLRRRLVLVRETLRSAQEVLAGGRGGLKRSGGAAGLSNPRPRPKLRLLVVGREGSEGAE